MSKPSKSPLYLSPEEGTLLLDIINLIAGNPDFSRRRLSDSIGTRLQAMGMVESPHANGLFRAGDIIGELYLTTDN